MKYAVYFLIGFGFAASAAGDDEGIGRFVLRIALWPVAAGVTLGDHRQHIENVDRLVREIESNMKVDAK